MDRFEQRRREHDREFAKAQRSAMRWFVFAGLAAVAALGLLGWAITRLVLHFT